MAQRKWQSWSSELGFPRPSHSPKTSALTKPHFLPLSFGWESFLPGCPSLCPAGSTASQRSGKTSSYEGDCSQIWEFQAEPGLPTSALLPQIPGQATQTLFSSRCPGSLGALGALADPSKSPTPHPPCSSSTHECPHDPRCRASPQRQHEPNRAPKIETRCVSVHLTKFATQKLERG